MTFLDLKLVKLQQLKEVAFGLGSHRDHTEAECDPVLWPKFWILVQKLILFDLVAFNNPVDPVQVLRIINIVLIVVLANSCCVRFLESVYAHFRYRD